MHVEVVVQVVRVVRHVLVVLVVQVVRMQVIRAAMVVRQALVVLVVLVVLRRLVLALETSGRHRHDEKEQENGKMSRRSFTHFLALWGNRKTFLVSFLVRNSLPTEMSVSTLAATALPSC